MKKFASKSGFTLVELIVVIAILGILAGIAVPAYSGYIAKAKEARDLTQLDAIKTAVIFDFTEEHISDDPVPEVETITVTKGSVAVTPATDDLDITPYYAIANFDFESDNTQAVWTASTQEWELTK